MDNVCLYRAQWFVSDHHKDLLLLLDTDEVSKPGFLGQPVPRTHTLTHTHTHTHTHTPTHTHPHTHTHTHTHTNPGLEKVQTHKQQPPVNNSGNGYLTANGKARKMRRVFGSKVSVGCSVDCATPRLRLAKT